MLQFSNGAGLLEEPGRQPSEPAARTAARRTPGELLNKNKNYQIYERTVFIEQIENGQYTQSNCIGNDVSLLYGREQRGQRRRKSNSDTKGSGAMCTGGQDC